MPRKKPIRHTVRSHRREGKSVKSFERGSGVKQRKIVKSRVVGSEKMKSIPPEQRVNTLAGELQRAREKGVEMRFCYHGTRSREDAERILKVGFKDGTYFTPQMANAYAGGARPYIFEVAFCMDFEPRGGWQWVETGITSTDRIHALYVFDKDPLYENFDGFYEMGKHNVDLAKRKRKEAGLG